MMKNFGEVSLRCPVVKKDDLISIIGLYFIGF